MNPGFLTLIYITDMISLSFSKEKYLIALTRKFDRIRVLCFPIKWTDGDGVTIGLIE